METMASHILCPNLSGLLVPSVIQPETLKAGCGAVQLHVVDVDIGLCVVIIPLKPKVLMVNQLHDHQVSAMAAHQRHLLADSIFQSHGFPSSQVCSITGFQDNARPSDFCLP